MGVMEDNPENIMEFEKNLALKKLVVITFLT